MIFVCPRCGTENNLPDQPDPVKKYTCGNCKETLIAADQRAAAKHDPAQEEAIRFKQRWREAQKVIWFKCPYCKAKLKLRDPDPNVKYQCHKCKSSTDGDTLILRRNAAIAAELDVDKDTLIESLVAEGVSLEDANKIARESVSSAAYRNALYGIGGGLIFMTGGAILTAVTYEAAEPGGTYFVFWGAIGIGALSFIGGLIMLAKNWITNKRL